MFESLWTPALLIEVLFDSVHYTIHMLINLENILMTGRLMKVIKLSEGI